MAHNDPIAWFKPEFTDDDIKRVTGAIQSGFVNDGPLTRELESVIAAEFGMPHALAVTSGTAAITIALKGLGVTAGDEVIVPDFTFIATANAVDFFGAKVVFADIKTDDFTVDPADVARRITPKTKAVVAVDVNGRGCDYEKLEPLCREKKVALVCDATEGMGSKHKGRWQGTYGDAGCFSFSPNKIITTGQGGMVITKNSALHDAMTALKDQGRPKRGTGGDDEHPHPGYNFKFTDLQAAMGLAQMPHIAARRKRAQERDEWLRHYLKGCPHITFPSCNTEPDQFVLWADLMSEKKEAIRAALQAKGMGQRGFWHPIHRQKPYQRGDEGYANTIEVSRLGFWVPSNFSLTEAVVKDIADTIRSAAS